LKPIALNNVVKLYQHPMKVWKKIPSVNDLSFEINQGEVVGFVGHNGAGKTTTIKMIMGFIKPTKGNILVFEKKPGEVDVKRRIGFLPERPYFNTSLTAKELLTFFASISGLNRREIPTLTEACLRKVGLADNAKQKLSTFSKGMLQRVGLAQAIIHNPDLVILDEPMSGLDPVGRAQVKEIIRSLKKEGKTVLFSSHILSDIEDLSDRILIIENGVKKSFGRYEEIVPVEDIKYVVSVNYSKDAESRIFSEFDSVKKSEDSFVIEFETESAMGAALSLITDKGYSVKSAGAVRPTLEQVVFNQGDI